MRGTVFEASTTQAAFKKENFFTLHAPTGSGKTIAALENNDPSNSVLNDAATLFVRGVDINDEGFAFFTLLMHNGRNFSQGKWIKGFSELMN
ncbi:hypothetical protein GCM10007971_23730 [Oceanobacillus indicireducens]|uniref:Uncharacterized protein n=1 Tax=Oceanobacillus indicireducens TaxID=1004261 RepID=A0A917XZH1_9BACI|nr:hypothetical protein GCM10007971_23730 [Oceanobacillus indicireducens]